MCHLVGVHSRHSGPIRRPTRERRDVSRLPLAWGDFHERSRFARCNSPMEKWGLLVVLLSVCLCSVVPVPILPSL